MADLRSRRAVGHVIARDHPGAGDRIFAEFHEPRKTEPTQAVKRAGFGSTVPDPARVRESGTYRDSEHSVPGTSDEHAAGLLHRDVNPGLPDAPAGVPGLRNDVMRSRTHAQRCVDAGAVLLIFEH